MNEIAKNSYALSGLKIGGGLGNIAGIIYAIKVKSGFWKGFGFFALGGLTVGGVGYGIGSLIKKKGVIVVQGQGDDLSITTQDKKGGSNPFDRFKNLDPSKYQIKTPDLNPSFLNTLKLKMYN
tara:strand:+ start:10311 stop:10679 length:369 start_codon:yes stop_codon:yes gene_type:complete